MTEIGNRASSHTEEEKERRFQDYLRSSEPYNAAIEAAGDEPWHKGDIEARRELFFRRYKSSKGNGK
jgi:hypothetical protein